MVSQTFECECCGKTNETEGNLSCTIECAVELFKRAGAKVIAPNNLPITCFSDHAIMEHEHADHPTYMFPVTFEYFGEVPELEEWDVFSYQPETHALIYTDGCIAVTLYEYVFAVCYLRENEIKHGSLWKDEKWRLTASSLEKVLKASPREL